MILNNFTLNNYSKFNYIDTNFPLINKLKIIRSDIHKCKIDNLQIIKYKFDQKLLNKMIGSFWVSNKLTYDYLDYEINIKWNNNNIYLKTTKEKFNKIKKRLIIFIKMINYLQQNTNTNVNIYLVLSNLKKIVNNDIIDVDNINSGYTDIMEKYIFIWREEEFEKVTFHELLHLFNKDHRLEDNSNKYYYEAITDFKAIIYNCIYVSILTKIKIKVIIDLEYKFIYNQAIMINNNLEFNNYKEKSHAYSYFILKYFIFTYFYNKDFNSILFDDIFNKNNNLNKLINNIQKKKLNKSFINTNSARMTLFELE